MPVTPPPTHPAPPENKEEITGLYPDVGGEGGGGGACITAGIIPLETMTSSFVCLSPTSFLSSLWWLPSSD